MSGGLLKAEPLSRRKIRGYAANVRGRWGLSGKLDIVRFLEFRLPEAIPDFELLVFAKEDLGATEGVAVPEENLIALREDVYDGACTDCCRARFTCAHELGHLLLHRTTTEVAGGKPPAFAAPEWQANTFAAELLVPANEVIHDHTLATAEDIENRYGVSRRVAEIQWNLLRQAGLVDDGRLSLRRAE